jgi:hypothetical protein
VIKCILATKVGDSLLCEDDGSLQPIYPNTFYEVGIKAYWMLKLIGNYWIVVRVLIVKSEATSSPTQNPIT